VRTNNVTQVGYLAYTQMSYATHLSYGTHMDETRHVTRRTDCNSIFDCLWAPVYLCVCSSGLKSGVGGDA